MSREDSERLHQSLKALGKSDAFVSPAVRRAMELRLYRFDEGDLEPDTEEPTPPSDPEELAASIVALLREAMDKAEDIWQEFGLYADPEERIKSLEEGAELRNMVEAYLEQPSDDKDLLEDLHDEILQQKISFADAVIEVWIRDFVSEMYLHAQAKKIRRLMGSKAIRLVPITQRSINEWIEDGTPPDELFCEGYVASVNAFDGEAGVSIGAYPDGSGPVTDTLVVWRRDGHAEEVVQEAKLEIIEASEIEY